MLETICNLLNIGSSEDEEKMPSTNYAACKHSATLKVTDEAVLSMLRGLAQYCESGTYPQISWGGTKVNHWLAARKHATFRFTKPDDREFFIKEATRLLPAETWELTRTSG
ncbi:hypothetical protein A5N83_03275 [Rhodococcus sp. 1139]|nr:hypothetical protein A5N83_03275 [Rhodococcus sp. 1139]